MDNNKLQSSLENLGDYIFSIKSKTCASRKMVSIGMMKKPIEKPHGVIEKFTYIQILKCDGKTYSQLNQCQLTDDFDTESWCGGVFLTEDKHNDLQWVINAVEKYMDTFTIHFYFDIAFGDKIQ